MSSLSEKGVKAADLGPESSDTEIKDAFEGKYKMLSGVTHKTGYYAENYALLEVSLHTAGAREI